MDTSVTVEPTVEEEAQWKSQIDHSLAEIKRLNSEMVSDQVEMNILTSQTRILALETRTILSEIWATLARIETI